MLALFSWARGALLGAIGAGVSVEAFRWRRFGVEISVGAFRAGFKLEENKPGVYCRGHDVQARQEEGVYI